MELYEEIELQECPICGGPAALEEENDWGLPVTPEGKMEERKRKYAAALHSVVQ